MLDPQGRELLLDALRPDPGTVLDGAVGTSFTLDLEALLLAPLAFSLFENEGAATDPTALLAAIQQHAERLVLYCDRAHIRSQPAEQKLFVLLESSVLPVTAPGGGSFHPKLWVLRFRDAEEELRHRVLILSRNLTFDTSWDLIVRLEEDPDGAVAGRDVSTALRGLDRLAPSSITASLASSVSGLRFAVPHPFDSGHLHLLGVDAERAVVDPIARRDGDRTLVVSPFLTPRRLGELEGLGRRRTLVSRASELERLGGAAISAWGNPLILRQAAEGEAPDDGPTSDAPRGLHAKLYVTDHDERATWFVGSANATTSAVRLNVEAVLELTGAKGRVGVGSLLSESGREVRFRDLLEELVLENEGPVEQTEEELERERLEDLVKALSKLDLKVGVETRTDGYDLHLTLVGEVPVLGREDRLTARPVTRTTWTTVDSASVVAATLTAARTSEITSLIAFRLQGAVGLEQQFVLSGELSGAPADRIDRLLVDLIPDRRRLALLLFLMLAAGDPDSAMSAVARGITGSAMSSRPEADGGWNVPLYEALVRASARDRRRLREIDGLVRRLSATAEGRDRLPEGFEAMWESFAPLVREGRL